MSKIIIEKNVIKKIFYNWQKKRFFNEIFWLKKFSKYNFSPKILNIDYGARVLTITNEGDTISKYNAPSDWKKQLDKILILLKKNNCFHGDINPGNILVKNKKLKLIDFAQSSKYLGKDISILKKRMFYDTFSKSRIDLFLSKIDYISNDLRTMVIWNKNNTKYIEKEISKSKHLSIIDKILVSKNCYEDIYKDRIFWLDKFYNRPIDRNTSKLKNDIICYIILSKKPTFKLCKMYFTGEHRFVDLNIFKFKMKIRKKRKNIIHIADNFEEAKRNSFYLSRTKNNFPYSYFVKSQYQHKTIKSVFDKLNKEKKLKYVVLRDKKNSQDDIDILCNNFFLFKRAIDGQSFKHKSLSFLSNTGDPLEDYGFKVSNFIKVKDREICVDIRSVGDGYFDNKWQLELIKNRIKYSNYFVSSKKNNLLSTIYHIVYHKGYKDQKYDMYLKSNLRKNHINLDYLKNYIDKYLKSKNYFITRPSDLTIPIIFKMSKDDYIKEFKHINHQIEKNNFSGANKMMFNLLFGQGIYCLLYNFFFILLLKNNFRYLKEIIKTILFKKFSRSHLKYFFN